MSFISNLSFFRNIKSDNIPRTEELNQDENEEEELPLLEELDIDFKLIIKKLISIFLFKKSDLIIWREPDMTGPFIYIMIITVLLLLVI